MELDQWLMVYLALAQSEAARERSAWAVFVGGLIVQAILLMGVVFLISTDVEGRLAIGLIGLGFVSGLAWSAAQARVRAEAAHLGALLRGIEQNFAGGEFLRSLHRFASGERVCTSAAQWTCGEWLPSVCRLSFSARLAPRFLAGFTPALFLLGWIALLVRTALL